MNRLIDHYLIYLVVDLWIKGLDQLLANLLINYYIILMYEYLVVNSTVNHLVFIILADSAKVLTNLYR